jgi:hypothetical protein
MYGNRSIADPGLSERPAHGRAFRVSLAVVGLVFGLEALVIGVGLMRRPEAVSVQVAPPPPESPIVEEPSVAIAPELPLPDLSDQPVLDPGLPVPPAPVVEEEAPPRIEEEPVDPSALFAALAAAARSHPLPDAILEALVGTGAELRGKGNTQGAMKNFREVESAYPEHPRVLSELAATLGLLRLGERAEGYWERVVALGAGAGPYLAIAEAQLRGGEAAPEATEAATGKGTGGFLRIGEIKVEEQAPSGEGQKVSLSVVIDADPASMPEGEQMSLVVLFFDRLANGEVRPSTADTSYLYPTEPYDWQTGGTEAIIVNYHQPAFTEEQKRELGDRDYYGYVIELYYRDELQDKVAMPEDVAGLRFPVETVAPLAPSPAGSAPAAPQAGPENALFPDSVLP